MNKFIVVFIIYSFTCLLPCATKPIASKTISSSIKINSKLDSLKTELSKAAYKENTVLEINLRKQLGVFFLEKGNLQEAIEYLIGAKSLAEHYKLDYEKALVNEKLANAYMFIFEHEKHYKLITEAIEIFEIRKDTLSLAKAYNNLAGGEKFRNEKKTFSYLNKAKLYASSLKNDQLNAEINIGYGTLYIREQKYDSAIYHLEQALPIVEKMVTTSKLCETLIKLGRSYRYLGKNDTSIEYLDKAYKISKNSNNYFYVGRSSYYLAQIAFDNNNKKEAFNRINEAIEHQEFTGDIKMKLETYNFLSSYYKDQNIVDSALYYNQLAYNLKDTINERQNLAEIKNIEWYYKLNKKQQVIDNLKEKQLVLEQKQKAEEIAKIWFWTALAILITLCISLFFFFKNRISLINKERLLVKIKSEKQKIELEQRNKELVAHTMQIYSKSSTILEIKKNINDLKSKYVNSKEPNLIKDMQRLNFILDNNIRLDEEWEKLKIHFKEIHKGFYEKLKNKNNSLTQYDLKICTFIYLGFDTKKIAQILNIDYQSLRTQRYRMRKKMNLKTEENLEEYIAKIVSE